MTSVPKINVHRYPEQPNRVPEPDDYVATVEPADRKWIVYYQRDGQVRFAGKRNPATGAIVEDDAPIRYFLLWRHSDPTGVSGTGLVGHGYERCDGKATVHWLGSYPTVTTHERGMESVEAVHGHGGRTSIVYSDHENEVVVPGGFLPVASGVGELADAPIEAHGMLERVRQGPGLESTRHVLSLSTQDRGWVLGVGEPCREWLYVKCGDPQVWSPDSIVAPADRLVHGDLIEGVVIDGERRMFWRAQDRRTKMLGWRDVVELFAARPEALIVTRMTPSCGGDPAYHTIPIR